MTRYEVTKATDITPGTMKAFSLGKTRVLIINLGGEFFAVDELCPHLSVPLSRGKLEGECLTCVGHGSQFNLKDGSVTRWLGRKPGLISRFLDGKASVLPTYKVKVEGDTLYVEV
ncbi:MAG: nitrite reductase small subunit NirD [Anaerolineales bacterium]